MAEHPQYGRGRIVSIFHGGAEWLVRFDNGLRFRRPRGEFIGQASHLVAPAALSPLPEIFPMSTMQFAARQLLEALRVGVAPVQHIQEMTIGLTEERAGFSAGLNQAHQSGGAVRAVIGDYGYGKSHIVELVTQDALNRGFLVATVSLDLQELPAHHSFDIYAGLMRAMRYPDSEERGLSPLLQKFHGITRLHEELKALTEMPADPLAATLAALDNTTSSRKRGAWENWLMGGRRVAAMNRTLPYGVKLPVIYRTGKNARQIAYLFSGVSVMARLAGYSGLCLLIDEAESYSLLSAAQRGKADLFFSAVICAASREFQTRIKAADIPQHHRHEYPLTYRERQSLFFLFTVTRSDNRLPLDAWLDKEQIVELNPHQTPQEIGQFLQKVMLYHAQAYGYESGERQGQIRRAAAEHLALGMRNDKLSIRGVVRLAVELYDLLYLYPDYDTATMLDELREQMR